MPLAVRDYTWEETEKMLFLTVPLKGVKANKVDILSSEDYIKVHMRMFNIIMIMIFFGPCVILGICSRQYHNDTQIQRNLPLDGGGGGVVLQGRGFGNVNSGTYILVYTPIVNMIYLNIFLICAFNVYRHSFFFFLGKLSTLFL